MKKRFLIMVALLSILVFSYGTVQAATSAIDNLPGGAGVFYWQASPGGEYTLLNVQNVADTAQLGTNPAVTVHITFYDRDSNHIFDFECPLSPRDNWGAAITGNGSIITITPFGGSAYTGVVNGVPNCTTVQTAVTAGVGTDNLQYGYGTMAINRTDAGAPASLYRVQAPNAALLPPVGNNNGDARNENSLGSTTVVLPDLLFIRTAMIGPSGAYALNGAMLQGFFNAAAIQEDIPFWFTNTIAANALCAGGTVDWDNSGTFQAGPVALPDFNGIDIHAPELYITDNVTAAWGIVTDGCVRGGRRVALGSADALYWARFNVTPGLTETTLITVAPASNAHALNPARGIADTRAMTVSAYDDNQVPVSVTPLTPPEVGLSPFYSATNAPRPGNFSIGHSTVTAGEALVAINAPLFGYSYTTISGTKSDLYPLVKDRVWVETVNLGIADPVAGSDVRAIGY